MAPRGGGAGSLRAALGVILGLVAWVYLRTLRLRVVVDPLLDPEDPRPWVLSFWHGEQFPLLAWPRRRPTVALVSFSKDGEIQARALCRLGLLVERGSTSRGGARGLLAITKKLRHGHDAAFAVDGPRGPIHRVAPGARLAAARANATLVPMASATLSGVTFQRAWDRYRLPYPFGRVVVGLGAPLDPARTTDEELGRAILGVSAMATREVGMLRSPSHAVLRHARRARDPR